MDSENASSSSQTTLDYVRVLFAGEQRLRSGKVVMVCFVMAVFSVTFGLVAMGSLGMAMPAKFRLAFGIGSLFSAAMTLFLTINFLIDRRMAFEVTTAGIRNGTRRTVPWARIVRFVAGGTPTDATVRIFYGVGRPGFYQLHELLRDSPVSPIEYEALVAQLRTEVIPSNPQLQLDGYAPSRTLS